MHLHRTLSILFWMGLACLGLAAGCSPAPVVSKAAALPEITRPVRSSPVGPTKFARLVPTDTPVPTSTPRPTLTPTTAPTVTNTPTRAVTKPRPAASPVSKAASAGSPGPTANAPSLQAAAACAPIPAETYGTLPPKSAPASPPAENNGDLNLALRGYAQTAGDPGLIDLYGDTAAAAPQLAGLFSSPRRPTLRHLFQVYEWDWSANARAALTTDPEVTFVTAAVTPGETIHVPDAGTNVGLGYAALVLYASPARITLKYTLEDNVQRGYTLHLENLCVEPRLLALYRQMNAAGRGQLPAVYSRQAIGRAASGELGIAVRDTGAFLDPRSRKDWWRGY